MRLIESESAAKNALDLVLAYHVGFQAKEDPEGCFHVLAKDKDYEALIKHLRALGVRATRDEAFAKVSVLVDASQLTPEQRVKWVVERLARNKASRPGRKKTLLASIHALFQKKLPDADVERIFARMIVLKHITVSPQGHVTHNL